MGKGLVPKFEDSIKPPGIFDSFGGFFCSGAKGGDKN
jgi:hypothetical protein